MNIHDRFTVSEISKATGTKWDTVKNWKEKGTMPLWAVEKMGFMVAEQFDEKLRMDEIKAMLKKQFYKKMDAEYKIKVETELREKIEKELIDKINEKYIGNSTDVTEGKKTLQKIFPLWLNVISHLNNGFAKEIAGKLSPKNDVNYEIMKQELEQYFNESVTK